MSKKIPFSSLEGVIGDAPSDGKHNRKHSPKNTALDKIII